MDVLARLAPWRASPIRLKSSVVNELTDSPRPRLLSEAARRALDEARARREAKKAEPQRELGGRGGLDPARYGDWEIKGIACDF